MARIDFKQGVIPLVNKKPSSLDLLLQSNNSTDSTDSTDYVSSETGSSLSHSTDSTDSTDYYSTIHDKLPERIEFRAESGTKDLLNTLMKKRKIRSMGSYLRFLIECDSKGLIGKEVK